MRTPTLVLTLLAGASAAAAQERFMAPLPADATIEIRPDLAYAPGAAAPRFDLYLPAQRSAPVPVVVFVNGIGATWMRSHVQYTSWPRAVTARGLAGIALDTREASVDEDIRALLEHLRANAAALGVDPERVALWSCSANVRRGLPLAMALGTAVRSAVVYYGGSEVKAFRSDLPLLLIRAGLDGLGNKGLDALASQALRENAPVEVINVAGGSHGFDLRDDAETSRAAIRRTLDFLEQTLSGPLQPSVLAQRPLAEAIAAVYREDWPDAAARYEALVAAEPASALHWEQLGHARRALGRRAAAIEAYTRALANGSPNTGRVGFAKATLQAEAGDVEGVFATLEQIRRFLRFFAPALRAEPVFAAVTRRRPLRATAQGRGATASLRLEPDQSCFFRTLPDQNAQPLGDNAGGGGKSRFRCAWRCRSFC